MGGGEWHLPMHRAPALLPLLSLASLQPLRRQPSHSLTLTLSTISMLLCVLPQFADLNAFKVPDQRDYVDRLSVNFVSVTKQQRQRATATHKSLLRTSHCAGGTGRAAHCNSSATALLVLLSPLWLNISIAAPCLPRPLSVRVLPFPPATTKPIICW
jgi:hypothetical protein